MKKPIALMLSLMLLVSCAAGGACLAEEKELSIVVTIFPIYDWVREIVKDNEHIRVTLLLDNGVDLHSYQPTARDIMTISTADLFIYVGGESDEWVEDVLGSAMNPGLVSINLVEAMGEDIKAEEIVEGMEHEHDHGHDGDEDEDHDHDHDHDHEHGHDGDEDEDHDHAPERGSVHAGVPCAADRGQGRGCAGAETAPAGAGIYPQRIRTDRRL